MPAALENTDQEEEENESDESSRTLEAQASRGEKDSRPGSSEDEKDSRPPRLPEDE
jgi:hypothetical protein